MQHHPPAVPQYFDDNRQSSIYRGGGSSSRYSIMKTEREIVAQNNVCEESHFGISVRSNAAISFLNNPNFFNT